MIRPQARRLHPLRAPRPTRLRRPELVDRLFDFGDLLGGVLLVIAAAYLWWGVVPR